MLTLLTMFGCGMLHVCKMRLWERLADSISGVAGLIPKKYKGTKRKEKVEDLFILEQNTKDF